MLERIDGSSQERGYNLYTQPVQGNQHDECYHQGQNERNGSLEALIVREDSPAVLVEIPKRGPFPDGQSHRRLLESGRALTVRRARRSISIADCDVVFDLRNAGGQPGGPLRLVALGPGANGAAQHHLTSIGLDDDAFRVELRTTLQSGFDLGFD